MDDLPGRCNPTSRELVIRMSRQSQADPEPFVVDDRGLLRARLAPLDGAVELQVHGELDVASAPALRSLVEGLQVRVVLDLAELHLIDVAGLNALLALRRTALVDVRRPRPVLVRLASIAGVAAALGVPTPPARRPAPAGGADVPSTGAVSP